MKFNEQVAEVMTYADKVESRLAEMGLDDRIDYYIRNFHLNPVDFALFLGKAITDSYKAKATVEECSTIIFEEFLAVAAKVEAKMPNKTPFKEVVH